MASTTELSTQVKILQKNVSDLIRDNNLLRERVNRLILGNSNLISILGGQTGISDHGLLSGLSDDDHLQYVHISTARTITAQHTFNPTSTGAPFIIGTNAIAQLVTGLNSQYLGGATLANIYSHAFVTVGSNASLTAERSLGTAGNGIAWTDNGANSTIIANVNLASPSGLEFSSQALRIADTIAGDGLTISAKVLAVGVGAGLVSGADSISLGAPGTLSVSTSNLATTPHTHAVTSSSNPGANASLLSSNASGYLQLVRLGLGTTPVVPLNIRSTTLQIRSEYDASNYADFTTSSVGTLTVSTTGTTGNLALNPAGDVTFNPTGNDVYPENANDLNFGLLDRKWVQGFMSELWTGLVVPPDTQTAVAGRVVGARSTYLIAQPTSSGSPLTITAASLTTGSSVSTTSSYNTASISPTSGRVPIICVMSQSSAANPPSTPTVSGAGLTWNLIDSIAWNDLGGATYNRRVSMFYGSGTPSSGALTISFSENQTTCIWSVVEFNNVDTGSPVVQSGTDREEGDTPNYSGLTLGAFGHASNATFAVFTTDGNNAITPEAGWSELNDHGNTSVRMETSWLNGNDTTITATSVAGLPDWGVIAVELRNGGLTAAIDVRHDVFSNGDIVRLESNGNVEYIGIVSSSSVISGGFRYTVSRNLDGSGADTWYAGDAVVSTGQTGSSTIDLYSDESIAGSSQEGPTLVVWNRASSTYNALVETFAAGNLFGLYGYGSGNVTAVGLGANTSSTTFLTADATNGVRIMRGTTQVSNWLNDTSILIGQQAVAQGNMSIASGALRLRTNTAIKIDIQADGDLFLGRDTASTATTNIAIFQNAQTYNSESVSAGNMLFGSSSAAVANILFNSNGINFRTGQTTVHRVAPDGTFVSANSNYNLDNEGLRITAATSGTFTSAQYPNSIRWMNGSSEMARLWTYQVGNSPTSIWEVSAPATETADIEIRARSTAPATPSNILLEATAGSNSSSITITGGSVGEMFFNVGGTNVGQVRSDGTLYFESISVGLNSNLTDGSILFTGNVISRKGLTNYTGYIFVPLQTPNVPVNTTFSTVGTSTLISAATLGIPTSARGVLLEVNARDTGAAGQYWAAGPSSANWFAILAQTEVSSAAGVYSRNTGTIPTGNSGEIYYRTQASGAGTLAVVVRVWGYFV